MGGMQPLPSTSPSATSGSTEPLQQLYDEMYNVDAPSLVPLPGTFSPLPPSSPTPTTTLGVNQSTSRRFSYPNSPIHMGSVSNGPQTQTTTNNTPQISAEPTSNIAAVVAAAEQALNTSNQPLQISKHFQQLRLHHGGKGGEINVPSSAEINASICNSTSMLTSSSSTTNPSSTTTNITGRNNSIPSFSKNMMNSSLDSNSSIISFNTGNKFSERAAAAKNRWKAKGSITQGHVPQRQAPAASLGSNTSGSHNLKTPHANLAHSHSFDDAFENGKSVCSSSGSAQLLHRRHTHHRFEFLNNLQGLQFSVYLHNI